MNAAQAYANSVKPGITIPTAPAGTGNMVITKIKKWENGPDNFIGIVNFPIKGSSFRLE